MNNGKQSTGTTAALAGSAAGYLITIFMWLCKHFQIDDMDLATATAFVSTALMLAGAIGHFAENICRFFKAVLRIKTDPSQP